MSFLMSSKVMDLNTPYPNNEQALELEELARSIVVECKQDRPSSTLETAIFLLRQTLDNQPSGHPFRSDALRQLGMALLVKFSQHGWMIDVREVSECMYEIMESTSNRKNLPIDDDHETLQLASSLVAEFCKSVEQSSIETATFMFSEALKLRPSHDHQRATTCFDLANSLVIQFHLNEKFQDLDYAISLLEQATHSHHASNPMHFQCLVSLAMCFYLRFHRCGDLLDWHRGVQQYQLAMQADKEAENLFRAAGTIDNVNMAITLLRQSLQLRPSPHPCRYQSILDLNSALFRRFEEQGHHADLEEIITLYREGLDLCVAPHPHRFLLVTGLGAAFMKRFEVIDNSQDLEEAIACDKDAVELCPLHDPGRHHALNNLGNALFIQAMQSDLPDLEETIAIRREALDLCPAPHPDRTTALVGLSTALISQFDNKGSLSSLEEAIALIREVLELTPSHHHMRYRFLSTLGTALLFRFSQKGYLSDLEQAIKFHREAVDLCPAPHPDRPKALHLFGGTLYNRFQLIGPIHLKEAIAIHREALELCPVPHPMRGDILLGLADALSAQFEAKGLLPDLEESITHSREALKLIPTSWGGQNILATALRERFKLEGHLSDLEEAVSLYQAILNNLPPGDPHRYLAGNLGLALNLLYSRTRQPEHLQGAIAASREGALCDTSSISMQFDNSRQWSRLADVHDHESALEAFQNTIDLLPRLSSLDMSSQARQSVLMQTRGFASEACSWAVRTGRMEKAVEFLSAARTVFWSQALHLRTPSNELQSISPVLAERLRTISTELEQLSHRDRFGNTLADADGFTKVRDIEKEGARGRVLNDERVRVLEEVRKLPGLDRFLLPKSFHDLQRAASNGPVVILSASDKGTDCLLITADGLKNIALPELHLRQVSALRYAIQATLQGVGVGAQAIHEINNILENTDHQTRSDARKGIQVPDHGYAPDDIFRLVLKVLWLTIACPVVQVLNLKISDPLPRLWWFPVGPFSFLPIHAAGIYGDETRECVSDYVISSYTPTLEALLEPPAPSTEKFSMLAVVEAEVPGQSKLPCAREELSMIQKHASNRQLVTIGTEDNHPSVEAVASSLADASLVHFACHGHQDLVNPLESALYLRRGQLTMGKIMETPLPNAQLAFVNACETAKGDDSTPDEALHLSASLLFAGFRGVVGTMWPIYDEDGPIVSDVFYGYLFREGKDTLPDPTEAAYALHLAVKKLQVDRKVSFRRWIPFIHMGI